MTHSVEVSATQPRRCVDCTLHLTPQIVLAALTCPLFGKPRHGVEAPCAAFVPKATIPAPRNYVDYERRVREQQGYGMHTKYRDPLE